MITVVMASMTTTVGSLRMLWAQVQTAESAHADSVAAEQAAQREAASLRHALEKERERAEAAARAHRSRPAVRANKGGGRAHCLRPLRWNMKQAHSPSLSALLLSSRCCALLAPWLHLRACSATALLPHCVSWPHNSEHVRHLQRDCLTTSQPQAMHACLHQECLAASQPQALHTLLPRECRRRMRRNWRP